MARLYPGLAKVISLESKGSKHRANDALKAASYDINTTVNLENCFHSKLTADRTAHGSTNHQSQSLINQSTSNY